MNSRVSPIQDFSLPEVSNRMPAFGVRELIICQNLDFRDTSSVRCHWIDLMSRAMASVGGGEMSSVYAGQQSIDFLYCIR